MEPAVESPAQPAAQPTAAKGPLRPSPKLPVAAGRSRRRGLGVAKPASPAASTEALEASNAAPACGKIAQAEKKHPRPRVSGDKPQQPRPEPAKMAAAKVQVPNQRQALSDDIQAELEAELAAADVEAMLSGSAGMPDRKEPLGDGARVQGQVLKIHDDNVFVALGGPDEGVGAFLQFKEEPAIGSTIEVIVRGVSREDGLYAA